MNDIEKKDHVPGLAPEADFPDPVHASDHGSEPTAQSNEALFAEIKREFHHQDLLLRVSNFTVNYGHAGPFLKVGFLDPEGHASFPAVAWFDPWIDADYKTGAGLLSFFYPVDWEGKGFETIHKLSPLAYLKMAFRKGWQPEDLHALVKPEEQSSDKLVRLRLEASVGTRCSEAMAYDYVHWVFTGKRRCWLFTKGEFLELKI